MPYCKLLKRYFFKSIILTDLIDLFRWEDEINTDLNMVYLCMSFFQYFMETPGATDKAFSHWKRDNKAHTPLLRYIVNIQ